MPFLSRAIGICLGFTNSASVSEFQPVPGQRRSWWGFFVLLLGLLGVYAWVQAQSGGKSKEELLAVALEVGNITSSVSATGALESITTVTVGSQVSGPVQEVLVDFNTPVSKGQALAILDPSEFEARLREAEGGLALAQAGLETAHARVANSRAAISQSETQVEVARSNAEQMASQVDSIRASLRSNEAAAARARAEMDNALLEYQRYEKLYETQLVAASERDLRSTQYRVATSAYEGSLANIQAAQAQVRQTQSQYLQARNNVVAAQAKLRADQATLQGAQAEVQSALARMQQSQAQVERARVDLDRSVLRSPVAGTVIERKVEPGQTVAASFTAPELFKIAKDLRQMQVRADVSEADIGRVRLEQKVTFTVDAYPDQTFEGKVTQVRSAPATTSNQPSNNVVVYGVLISALNPKLLLKPGMTATVSIAAEEIENVLLIPDEALRFLPPHPPDPEEEAREREKAKAREEAEEPAKDGKKKKKKKAPKGARGAVVWVPGEKGPQRRDILVGVSDGNFSQFLEGDLKAGDKVYTKILDEEKKRKKVRISF